VNCELHDLARIVNMRPAAGDANDRIVRCMAAVMVHGEPGWELDRPVVFVATAPLRVPADGTYFARGQRVQFNRIRDKYLRPIRGGLTGDEVNDDVPADAERVS
jgi:hypothetical protein